MTVITPVFLFNNKVLGQTANQEPLNPGLFTLVAAGMTVAGSLITYFLSNRHSNNRLRKEKVETEERLRKEKEETEERFRQAQLGDKIKTYSIVLEELDRALNNPEFHNNLEEVDKIYYTLKEIDRLGFLLKSEAFEYYKKEIRGPWRNLCQQNRPEFVRRVLTFRNDFAKEYNDLIPNYKNGDEFTAKPQRTEDEMSKIRSNPRRTDGYYQ
jgi:hypothetical protein